MRLIRVLENMDWVRLTGQRTVGIQLFLDSLGLESQFWPTHLVMIVQEVLHRMNHHSSFNFQKLCGDRIPIPRNLPALSLSTCAMLNTSNTRTNPVAAQSLIFCHSWRLSPYS